MPLIQEYTKASKIPVQFRWDKKGGRRLCILRLQSVYILYIQTNLLEKLEGLAQSVLNMVVTTFMDRDASLDSILVYVQIQIKEEEDKFSGRPLPV